MQSPSAFSNIVCMIATDKTLLRWAVFHMLELARAEEEGSNPPELRRVLAGIAKKLSTFHEKVERHQETSMMASLVFDVLTPVYRRVEAGKLKNEEEVRDALEFAGERLGFIFGDEQLNNFVALRDEIAGKGGAVDAAVTAMAASLGRTKRAVYARIKSASSKTMRKHGLLSATPPDRMKRPFIYLVNNALYALDVQQSVAKWQGSGKAAHRLRELRDGLMTAATSSPAVAPPVPNWDAVKPTTGGPRAPTRMPYVAGFKPKQGPPSSTSE